MGVALDVTLVDPMPGDPAEIRREAGRLATFGAKLREAVVSLRSLALNQTLEGQFAGKLVSESGNLANRFETLAVRYETVAPLLQEWAGHLEYAKDAAARAAADARAAIDLRKTALIEPPDMSDPVVAAMAEQRRRAALEEAERQWDLARGRLEHAVEYAERMGHNAARAIKDAIDDDLKDPSGGFLGLKDRWREIDGFVDDHAEFVKEIAKWTGYLGTAATFAALACPPLAGVAVGMTAVTATLDASLAATGNEN